MFSSPCPLWNALQKPLSRIKASINWMWNLKSLKPTQRPCVHLVFMVGAKEEEPRGAENLRNYCMHLILRWLHASFCANTPWGAKHPSKWFSRKTLMFPSPLPLQPLKIFNPKSLFFFPPNHCSSSSPKSIEQCGNGTWGIMSGWDTPWLPHKVFPLSGDCSHAAQVAKLKPHLLCWPCVSSGHCLHVLWAGTLCSSCTELGRKHFSLFPLSSVKFSIVKYVLYCWFRYLFIFFSQGIDWKSIFSVWHAHLKFTHRNSVAF